MYGSSFISLIILIFWRYRLSDGEQNAEMARLVRLFEITINDSKIRTLANTKGFRKGNISIALQEAIELWIKEGE